MLKNLFILLTILSFLFGSYLLLDIYNEVELQTIDQMRVQQELYSRQAAKGIASFFENTRNTLSEIATRKCIVNIEGECETELKNIYQSFAGQITAVTRIDKNGIIRYTYPENKSVIGINISNQEHNNLIIKTHRPVISDVFETVQGYRSVVYAYPVFYNDEYNGAISFVIPFNFIAKKFLEEIKIGQNGYAFVISREGILLYHPDSLLIGKDVREIFQNYPSVLKLTDHMMAGESGSLEYTFFNTNISQANSLNKIAYFAPILLEDTYWSVAVSVSGDEMLALNRGFRDNYILIVSLSAILIIAFLSLFFVTKNIDRRKMEDEAEKYKIVTEQTGQIIYESNLQSGIINWGGAVESLSGFTKEEFKNFSYENWLERIHPEDKSERDQKLNKAKLNNSDYNLEYRFRKKNETYIYVEERGVCKNKPGYKCYLMLGAIKDIDLKKKAVLELSKRKTELEKIVEERTIELRETNEILMQDLIRKRKAEESLIESKTKAELSDKLKSEFLAQMSHEIRTPINTILNFTSLIESETKQHLDDEIKDSFEIIDRAGNRIIRTIDLILDMSQIQTGSFETHFRKINLDQDILKNIYFDYKNQAEDKGLEFIYKNENPDTISYLDQYTTEQIFSNLIDNAIKYTKSGKVEILCEINQDNKISISVKDTGVGISEEYLPDLFKPFSQEEQGYTRKFEGNGLGLALVKKYCEINDAQINVSSSRGNGSCFTVEFTKSE